MNIEIGTIIKSFDFHMNEDCYYIGRVVMIDDNCLYCDTISRTFDGVVVGFNKQTFMTPKQGEMMMDEVFQRIVIL